MFRFTCDQGPLELRGLVQRLETETAFDASQRTIERDVRALLEEELIAHDLRSRLDSVFVPTTVR